MLLSEPGYFANNYILSYYKKYDKLFISSKKPGVLFYRSSGENVAF